MVLSVPGETLAREFLSRETSLRVPMTWDEWQAHLDRQVTRRR
ncbi:MAG: hypothetical protein ACT4QG_03820 [Sporichthyaceae bacterium]